VAPSRARAERWFSYYISQRIAIGTHELRQCRLSLMSLDIYTASLYRSGVLSTAKTAEQLTLAEAVERIEYGANCDRCHETRRVDLARLRDRLGPDFLVGDLRPRLRCAKCGKRQVIVVTLWKAASSTDRLTQHWK
jgi:hypothetical protein